MKQIATLLTEKYHTFYGAPSFYTERQNSPLVPTLNQMTLSYILIYRFQEIYFNIAVPSRRRSLKLFFFTLDLVIKMLYKFLISLTPAAFLI
jgi:hypothetical protein